MPRDQWCPVCKTYHENVGEKTDIGELTKPCPLIPADDPRNHPFDPGSFDNAVGMVGRESGSNRAF